MVAEEEEEEIDLGDPLKSSVGQEYVKGRLEQYLFEQKEPLESQYKISPATNIAHTAAPLEIDPIISPENFLDPVQEPIAALEIPAPMYQAPPVPEPIVHQQPA